MTVILVGLIVVLLAAAAYVGILLVRRSRSTPAEAEPDTEPGTERPRTVADLLRRRAAPVDESAGDQADALSGEELFVPQVPRQDGVAVPAVPDAPTPEPAAAAAPSRQPATPVDGLEIGDAPWRRAARMTGAEPGGAWETAPLPVVAAPVVAAPVVAAPLLDVPLRLSPRRCRSDVRRSTRRPCPGPRPQLRGRSPSRPGPNLPPPRSPRATRRRSSPLAPSRPTRRRRSPRAGAGARRAG